MINTALTLVMFLSDGYACSSDAIEEAEGVVFVSKVHCVNVPPKDEDLRTCLQPHLKSIEDLKKDTTNEDSNI